MTTFATTVAADLAGRRAASLANPASIPSTPARDQEFNAHMRAALVERDGKKFHQLDGYASTVNQTYTMYDFWGPYDEKIDGAAFDKTLSADPDVAFLLNHKGMTMARTTNKTLELSVDDTGLLTRAFLNPERQDVRDLVLAIDDENIDQMSFAFQIVHGQWSPDYTEYTILEVDLNRGDVSAVNYGANPYTSISARAKQAFEAIAGLQGPALFEARARLDARMASMAGPSPVAEPAGVSLALARLRSQLQD